MEEVLARIPREEVFEETGIQFLKLNTLFQLHAERRADPERLSRARCFLLIADLVNHFLTGRTASERTLATTTQLYNVRRGAWSERIADALDFPRSIFPEVVPPGTVMGPLRAEIASECGLLEPPPLLGVHPPPNRPLQLLGLGVKLSIVLGPCLTEALDQGGVA